MAEVSTTFTLPLQTSVDSSVSVGGNQGTVSGGTKGKAHDSTEKSSQSGAKHISNTGLKFTEMCLRPCTIHSDTASESSEGGNSDDDVAIVGYDWSSISISDEESSQSLASTSGEHKLLSSSLPNLPQTQAQILEASKLVLRNIAEHPARIHLPWHPRIAEILGEDYHLTERPPHIAEGLGEELDDIDPMVMGNRLQAFDQGRLDLLLELGIDPQEFGLLPLEPSPVALFEQGEETFTDCTVCLTETMLRKRVCCRSSICDDCVKEHCLTQVKEGQVRVPCPGYGCKSLVCRDEVLSVLPTSVKERFYKFLIDANKEPHIKTCPRCSTVMKVDRDQVKKGVNPKGVQVTCPECDLEWCFRCHAPFHTDLKCKEFLRGDKLVKNWAKSKNSDTHNWNAQRCPKCKIFIERISGCDHMQCDECRTNFCYKCGGRYRSVRLVGNHYSQLSILGCKYRFMPDRPRMRKFVRGSIFAGKLLAVPPAVALLAAGGAVVLGLGVVVGPVYGSYKLHKHLKARRERRRRERTRAMVFSSLRRTRDNGELDISGPLEADHFRSIMIAEEEEWPRRVLDAEMEAGPSDVRQRLGSDPTHDRKDGASYRSTRKASAVAVDRPSRDEHAAATSGSDVTKTLPHVNSVSEITEL